MITSNRARKMANNELGWWDNRRRERNRDKAIHNCYTHWYYEIKEEIEKTAKNGSYSFSTVLIPNFYPTDLAGSLPDLEWFSYEGQVNLTKEAMFLLRDTLEKKGFDFDFLYVHMNETELEHVENLYMHQLGRVRIKYEVTIDWWRKITTI